MSVSLYILLVMLRSLKMRFRDSMLMTTDFISPLKNNITLAMSVSLRSYSNLSSTLFTV